MVLYIFWAQVLLQIFSLSLCLVEGSSSCLKICMWYLRPYHRQLPRLNLAELMGKCCLPTTDSVHSQCITVSKRNLVKYSDIADLSYSLHIYIPSPWTCIHGCPHLKPWAEFYLGTFAETSLCRQKEETLKTLPHSDSVPSSFLLWDLCLYALPNPRVHKTVKALCSGLPHQWDDPYICTDSPDPQQCAVPGGKWDREHELVLPLALEHRTAPQQQSI